MISIAENDLEMSLDEFEMIRDFVHENSGVYFNEARMYLLKNRLVKRMSELGVKSVRDYFHHVKYDVSRSEFNRLMDLVTTNETSFFGNEPQLLSFSDEALPLLIKDKLRARQFKRVKLWSAGCSTGEEPYTLAIILLEKFKALDGWTARIIANDISEHVLQKARVGEYSGVTLRAVPVHLLERYFTKAGEVYRVKPEVKALVKFSRMNLNDERRISAISGLDVIFCRNVMTDFSEEIQKRLIRSFYSALRPGGYLYIGHSETLHGLSKAFRPVYLNNALVYQKKAVGAPTSAVRTETADRGGTQAVSVAGPAGGAARARDLLSKIKPTELST